MVIVWSASYRYFVTGLGDARIWGEFYWVLSVQDGLVSELMIGMYIDATKERSRDTANSW